MQVKRRFNGESAAAEFAKNGSLDPGTPKLDNLTALHIVNRFIFRT